MSGYTRTEVIGRFTKDPVVKALPSGAKVVEARLAANEVIGKDQAGKPREVVTYVNVQFWGRQAEVVAQYHKQGDLIFVEGPLRMDQWEDKKGGGTQTKYYVLCQRVVFLPKSGGRRTAVAGGVETAAADGDLPTNLGGEPPTTDEPAPVHRWTHPGSEMGGQETAIGQQLARPEDGGQGAGAPADDAEEVPI